MQPTNEARKFIAAIGALKLRPRAHWRAAEAERERLRTIRNQRLDRLKERSLAS